MNLSRHNRVKYSNRRRKGEAQLGWGSGGRKREDGGGFKNLKWKLYHGGAGDSEALDGERGRKFKDRLMSGGGIWQLDGGSTTTGGGGDGGGVGRPCRRLVWSDAEFMLQSSLGSPKPTKDNATNLDTLRLKVCSENRHFVNSLNHIQNQHIATPLVAFELQVELLEAQKRMRALEAERELFKKKLKLYLGKISEERSSWLRKERKKFCFIFDDLRDELRRERRKCKQIETICSKLLDELVDVSTLGKEFGAKIEKEKKERLLVDDLCRKLEQENEGNKGKIEALKYEYSRMRRDMEQERKMLGMAELMCEERVHMKLMDAQLFLEEKYVQINDLIADLEIFLRSRKIESDTLCEHEDILLNLERATGNASCEETVTFAGDVVSSFNPGGSKGSGNRIDRGKNDSNGKKASATNADKEPLTSQSSEITSELVKPLTDRKHAYNHEIENEAETNDRQLKAPAHGEQECSSMGSKNPHLGRAMKGCTERPRAIQKTGLKANLLEARFASQRIQLRGILKQKS